jgi:hypothetical protein
MASARPLVSVVGISGEACGQVRHCVVVYTAFPTLVGSLRTRDSDKMYIALAVMPRICTFIVEMCGDSTRRTPPSFGVSFSCRRLGEYRHCATFVLIYTIMNRLRIDCAAWLRIARRLSAFATILCFARYGASNSLAVTAPTLPGRAPRRLLCPD